MLYHYVASDKNRKIVEADFEAESIGNVLRYLAGKELSPVSVTPLGGERRARRTLFGGITVADKIFLTRYLSLMLRVGTDLLAAINVLLADLEKPAMRSLLLEVRDNLSRGRPLYEVFAHYPKVFSGVFVNLVKAAEASGNLEQTFERLSTSLQREAELRSRVQSAMIYPIILLIASLGIFMFLVVFALPRIAAVFAETGIQPPLFSRIVFGIGLFVNNNFVLLGGMFFLVILPLLYFFVTTPAGRHIAGRFMSRLPLIRALHRDLAIQRFAATFSSLMRAGIPIMETTRVTAEVVGREEFRASLLRIADEGLAKGLTIGEAFRRETVFPRTVTNLIAISEKAGHLEEVLETLSEFYATNVDSSVRSLVSILEPVLLMIMGLLVGSIAVAIIIPIYQLTNQF